MIENQIMNQTSYFQSIDDQNKNRFLTSKDFPFSAVSRLEKRNDPAVQKTGITYPKRLLWKLRILSILILLFHSHGLYSQNINFNKNDYRLEISKISSAIQVDGFLNEEAWKSAGVDSISWLHYPVDAGKAYAKTTVKMMYDEKNLYVGFISIGTLKSPVVQSLKRDDENNAGNSDGITMAIFSGLMDTVRWLTGPCIKTECTLLAIYTGTTNGMLQLAIETIPSFTKLLFR